MMSFTVGYVRATSCSKATNRLAASGEAVTAVAVPGWMEKATFTPRTAATGRSALIWRRFSISVGRAGSHFMGSRNSRSPMSFNTPT